MDDWLFDLVMGDGDVDVLHTTITEPDASDVDEFTIDSGITSPTRLLLLLLLVVVLVVWLSVVDSMVDVDDELDDDVEDEDDDNGYTC